MNQQQYNRYQQDDIDLIKKQSLRRRNQRKKNEEPDSSSSEELSEKMAFKRNKHRYHSNSLTPTESFHNKKQYNSDSSMTLSEEANEPAITIRKARVLNSHRTVGTTTRRLSESSAAHDRNTKTVSRSGHNRKMWRNELHVNPSSRRAQPQRRYSSDGTSNEDSGQYLDDSGTSGVNVHRRGHTKAHNAVSHRRRIIISNLVDVGIRVMCVIAFANLEIMQAYKRKIYMEELWLYKNPRLPDIVSPNSLIIAVLLVPFCATIVHYLVTQDRRDFLASNWAWTMSVCLNGIITSTLKITIGRPRPDFFYRCFPDGIIVLNNVSDTTSLGNFEYFNCTGNAREINEGRKSFPSGHSSFAFASFGFVGLYLAAKLHALSSRGRGQSWRLCLSIAPFFIAALVAISRYCDYHHHWQDVLAGSVIGTIVTYFVYRQYYPSLYTPFCEHAYSRHSSSLHGSRTRSHRRKNISYASIPSSYDTNDGYANVRVLPDENDEIVECDNFDATDVVDASNAEYTPLIDGAGKENNKLI